MSEPEISHRCVSCGAAIRQPASFCPQCGKPMMKLDDTIAIERPAPPETSAPTVALDDGNGMPPQAAPSPERATRRLDDPLTQTLVTDTTRAEPDLSLAETQSLSAALESAAPPDTRTRVNRATTAAREVIEDNVRPGVEKLRRASNVVIEGATYDPSLRFILVATVLFVLFLILLILSKWVG